jgi:hypothetical protein
LAEVVEVMHSGSFVVSREVLSAPDRRNKVSRESVRLRFCFFMMDIGAIVGCFQDTTGAWGIGS